MNVAICVAISRPFEKLTIEARHDLVFLGRHFVEKRPLGGVQGERMCRGKALRRTYKGSCRLTHKYYSFVRTLGWVSSPVLPRTVRSNVGVVADVVVRTLLPWARCKLCNSVRVAGDQCQKRFNFKCPQVLLLCIRNGLVGVHVIRMSIRTKRPAQNPESS